MAGGCSRGSDIAEFKPVDQPYLHPDAKQEIQVPSSINDFHAQAEGKKVEGAKAARIPSSTEAITVGEQKLEGEVKVASEAITYDGVEGKTALELLKASHSVKTKEFSGIGEFIKEIDGKAAESGYFWAFYLNGAQATVGASSYVTKVGDKIEWKLEKLK